MPEQPEGPRRQKGTAGRDANIVGRDLIINAGGGSAGVAVPGLLPRDVPAFTGRDEHLARLAGLAGGDRVVVTVITGTPGVGKTALAVHAAHQLLAQFWAGHLYADLRGYTEGQNPAEPGEVLAVFLRRLGVPAKEVPAEVEERSGLLRQLLASQRVLMVLDNARSEGQVRPLLPGAGGSLVLVTSRSLLPGLEADERISLDMLSEDEAAAMLGRLVGTDRAAAEPQALGEVAGLCGRLPLALRISGQVLAAHPVWPVARMTQLLASEQDRLAGLDADAGDLQIRAAFMVSYRLLAGVDAWMFRLLGLHPGPNFTIAAAEALAGIEAMVPAEARVRMEDVKAERILVRLTEASLVTEDPAGRFGMHDLLRLFARSICCEVDSEAKRESAEARLVGYYAELARFLDSCLGRNLLSWDDRALWISWEQDVAGAALSPLQEAAVRFLAERRCLLAALGLAAKRDWDDQVLQLSEHTGKWLTMPEYVDDLLAVMEAALAAARRTRNASAGTRAMNSLGGAYRELRRFEEAVTCYQQSLAIYRETADRDGECQTLNSLGDAYQQMQQPGRAAECWRVAAAAMRDIGDRKEARDLEQKAANVQAGWRPWRRRRPFR